MKTVHEVSRLTGVSVRTLHHYDAIGLLKPARTTDAGYRLYDDAALKRLQNILIFRELQFPLKEIKAILDSPEFDPKEALEQQIGLLELRRKHIDELIAYARRIQKEGEETMNFSTFNKEEINRYKEEVRERWGSTRISPKLPETALHRSIGDSLIWQPIFPPLTYICSSFSALWLITVLYCFFMPTAVQPPLT